MILVAADTETTGLEAGTHAILTAAFVAYNTNTDTVLGELDLKLNPTGRMIDPEALKINQIDLLGHLTESESPEKCAANLRAFIRPEWGRVTMLAHNAQFDLGFIRDWLGEPLFKRLFHYQPLCTMNLSLWLNHYKIIQTGGNKLQQLAAHYDIDPGVAHSALSDARTCLAVYKKLRGVLAKNVA